ncbi:cupin domain-containing protein [Candidatus Saccharibacteria bacterium]|nr:cupin domain-containing protein [Candidatus Saccharibacteria bacterium]
MKHLRLTDSEFEQRDGYGRSVLLNGDDFQANTKLQLMQLAAAQRIRPHHHKERTECFRIVSGTGEIRINNKVVATSPDDVVLCEPGDIHEFSNLSDSEFFIFMVVRTNDPGNEDMIWEEDHE